MLRVLRRGARSKTARSTASSPSGWRSEHPTVGVVTIHESKVTGLQKESTTNAGRSLARPNFGRSPVGVTTAQRRGERVSIGLRSEETSDGSPQVASAGRTEAGEQVKGNRLSGRAGLCPLSRPQNGRGDGSRRPCAHGQGRNQPQLFLGRPAGSLHGQAVQHRGDVARERRVPLLRDEAIAGQSDKDYQIIFL